MRGSYVHGINAFGKGGLAAHVGCISLRLGVLGGGVVRVMASAKESVDGG